MRKYVVSCLMLAAFMLVLTGMPLQLLNIDLAKSAYAMGFGGRHHGGGESYSSGENHGGSYSSGESHGGSYDGGDHGGNCNDHKVPEPATLSLLGAGIAGVGIYSFIRKRNSK
jgi:uncharacterized membrane protein